MFRQRPADEELAFHCLTFDDVREQYEAWVWAENVEAFTVFAVNAGQWRMGPAGPVALDYLVIHEHLRMLGLPPEKRKELFADVQVIESGALEQLATNGKKK